jgi:hypothetical protein
VSLLFLVTNRRTVTPRTISYLVSAELALRPPPPTTRHAIGRYVRGSAKILLIYKFEIGKLYFSLVRITTGRVLLSHRRCRHCELSDRSSASRTDKKCHTITIIPTYPYIPTTNSMSLRSQHIIPIAFKKYLNRTCIYIYILLYIPKYIVISKYFIFFSCLTIVDPRRTSQSTQYSGFLTHTLRALVSRGI